MKKGLIISVIVLSLMLGCATNKDVSARLGQRELTVLHINDFHASFDPHKMYALEGAPMGGGIQVLSGYLNHYKKDKNTMFVIAGDMFQGSVIDVLTKGEAVVDVLNQTGLDVVTLGNHEMDHGIERCREVMDKANFAVVSANLKEIETGKAVAKSKSIIIEKNGMKILVIGLITRDKDGKELEVTNYLEAVQNVTKTENSKVDFTIVLTHIGYKEDVELAKKLTPKEGVDLIVGGHTHTVLQQADVVNGIPIVQAGANCDYLGKIVCQINTDNNTLISSESQLIPVVAGKYENDKNVVAVVEKYNAMAGDEIEAVIAHLGAPLLHPSRIEETELGNFACDVLLEYFDVDLAFQNSGGLRRPIPKEVRLKHVLESFPFGNTFMRFDITGKQLRVVLENNAKSDDWYQMPKTLAYTFDSKKPEGARVISIKFKGKEITDDQVFSAVTNNYVWNKKDGQKYLGMNNKELIANGNFKAILDLDKNIYINYLKKHEGNMPSFAKSSRIVDVAK